MKRLLTSHTLITALFAALFTCTLHNGSNAQTHKQERPIVRLIYFLPNDRAPQPDIDAEVAKLIKDVQQLYANQMEAHGFDRKTFIFQTDASGNAVVHHIRGKFAAAYYEQGTYGKVSEEIDEQFDISKSIYLAIVDSGYLINGAPGVASKGNGSGGGLACINNLGNLDRKILLTAHELGHTFGLGHDFRNRLNIMSAGWFFTHSGQPIIPVGLSKCTAELLDVHHYFKARHQSENVSNNTKIQMLTPIADSPNTIRLRFEITDVDGLHQARLYGGTSGTIGCKRLTGNSNSTVEFTTTTVTPRHEHVHLDVIDVYGNISGKSFPIDVISLLPSKVVSIPDVNLAAAVRKALNLAPGNPLTTLLMLELTHLNAGNYQITDLTGLEYAINLTEWLDLQGNTISDISPISGLAKLTDLYLDGNNIADVAPLAGLTQLKNLYLENNTLSDISALAELTQLIQLTLNGNNISDVSPLAALTQLTYLNLTQNNISDVSPLAALTQLTRLVLSSNNISDVSPLMVLNLTENVWNLPGLYIQRNPLNYASVHTHIPALQAKGVEVQYDQRTPTKLLKISGDAQQAVTNSELPLPFVVQVQDQRNRAFAEVPVTFSITNGSGKLSTLTTTTDTKGRAKTRLTLGQTEGETTIRATAAKISQPIQFTIKAILPTSFVQLPDTNLTAKIAETLGKPTDASMTAADMLTLTSLTANNTNINDLTGLQHASNLTTLTLDGNNLSTIDLLTGLTQLTTLSLDNNKLSNIAPLVELAQLETLSLENNNLSDVAPLVELTELKTLRLRGNLLSYPALYTTIPTLRSSGVNVGVDTRTPTTLINTPGTPGVAGEARQILVEVQDQNGIAFAGVPVTFTLTAAGGHRSTSKATSNLNGKAITTLTLGPEPGENVVSATVTEIQKPLTFRITTIDVNTLVHIPDVNLRAKIAEILNKPKNATLNAGDLLTLTSLDARNANIQDLTGIEYAHNLNFLNLGAEYIEGKGNVNSNTISDFSPIAGLTRLTRLNLSHCGLSDTSFASGLTQLTYLFLDNNSISDISPLAKLIQLNRLFLSNNTISDVSPIAELTQLTYLFLGGNSISDISPLANLTQLTDLLLNNNTISDVSPLANLTQLTLLSLYNNAISDISPLANLTQLNRLWLWNNIISDVSPIVGLNLTGTEWDSTGLNISANPLNYASINTHIPAMQAKGIEVKFDNRAHSVLVKISEDTREGEAHTTLVGPFVVEALDEHGATITGRSVTFRVSEGDGRLSVTNAITDAEGRAQTTLTLGPNPGVIKIRVTAAQITYPVIFTVIVTEATRLAADVNGDGVVNIQDLVLVSSNLGQTGENAADVNGDGVVNIQDLVRVAGALGDGAAAAPSLHASDLEGLTAANIQQMLTQARLLALTDPAYLRGIVVLERLLARLLPKETALLPNYPNPFNPETWIPYQLAESAEVTLCIYAVDGTLVRTLSLGHKAVGIYQSRSRAAYWGGKNQIGEPVASGVYFYTLTAGDFTATRKMLIRK